MVKIGRVIKSALVSLPFFSSCSNVPECVYGPPPTGVEEEVMEPAPAKTIDTQRDFPRPVYGPPQQAPVYGPPPDLVPDGQVAPDNNQAQWHETEH